VHEAITNAAYTGYLDVEECQLEQFSRIVPRLRIAPWRPWLQGQGGADTWGYKDFYVGRGILAETNDLGCSPAGIRGYTLSVAGKARGTLAQLNSVIKPEEWEHTTF
jgi:hypothetical protein